MGARMADTPKPFPGDLTITDEVWRSHKLTPEERALIVASLGRPPSYTELGVVSVMWSEHCSYKSSRVHLRGLPTKGPQVIQGPGENAGVVDIGDGYAVVFKIESHNHPSYIEPYQGAATGVGGIVRDVFTMGARPIALLNSLRFGRPDHPRTSALLHGVVAGIGGYGNCLGVPTVGGEVAFDGRYDGNILVNAFCCGIVRTDRIFYGRADGIGNPVLYVGARTGRDGIHGATMASDEFSAEGPSQRPTVQVGDPFMEKLLLEACLEIFAEDLLVGIQDMGAAGLTSSSVEMASRAGKGLELDLDLIPRRARRMTPYEILLSESQERMLLVTRPGCEDRVRAICDKWDLDAAVIGRVTDTGRWVIKATPGYDPLDPTSSPRAPVTVCDLPVDILVERAPVYDRPRRAMAPRQEEPNLRIEDVKGELLALLRTPSVGSKRWVWRQYDGIVRGGTVVSPGSDAGVVRVPCEVDGKVIEKWLAFACDGNARFVELDPFVGGAMVVAECCRNLVISGAKPIGITDCLNYGSPENPIVMEQFARSLEGIAAACRALEVPIVSGNVSLYNETDGRPILPTPILTAVGQLASPSHLVKNTLSRAGDAILLLGELRCTSLGGSEFLASKKGETLGRCPSFDLAFETRLQQLCLSLARSQVVTAMHDVADGGLLVALVELCSAHHLATEMIGARGRLSGLDTEHLAAHLFGEAPSRVLVACSPEHRAQVEALAKELEIPCTYLAESGGKELSLEWVGQDGAVLAHLNASLEELRHGREHALASIVGEHALVS